MFKPIVIQALKEDIAEKDITSAALIPKNKKAQAVIIVKQKAVLCGVSAARLAFQALDKHVQFKTYFKDGDLVPLNSKVISLKADARVILGAERTALNFLAHLSGVATQTHKFLEMVRPYHVKIFDTRKTLPGLRLLEKYAVRCAGGNNHRKNLNDMILIKDNHLSVLKDSSVRDIIKLAKQKKSHGVKIEVEVKNFKQYQDAALANPDIIMLDNMAVSEVRRIVKFRKDYKLHHQLEVSGNISFDNVRSYAATGVERISIGALTHSASSVDFTLKII
ncbi:MAG: carboxylating nicotinate-nucleotide diphosphorylase [Candidatus Omnitrophica bacterium]|nr:carboxylating nicotinate-nucleotide diphosphorylase [Candidatus Omnitrophota bacterium]